MFRARAVLLAIAAALPVTIGPASAETLVGVGLPRTGQNAWNGTQTEAGVEQAVADLNGTGGLPGGPLRLVAADDHCDPEQAAVAARKLVADGVRVVFGHQCSAAAIAAAPVYEAAGVVLISTFATNPELTEHGLRLVFRVVGRDDQQAVVAASRLAERFAGEKIAVLHDTRPYGFGLATLVRQRLRERGVEPALFSALEPGAVDHWGVVRRMRDLGVGVIYYGGYQDEGGLVRRQSWDAGLRVPMLSGDGFSGGAYWLVAGPEAAAATLMTLPPDPRGRPEAREAVGALRKAGHDVVPTTLHAYAAVQAWAQATRAAGTTAGAAVAAALRAGRFDTVIGRIGFDAKGDLVGPASFIWYAWREGAYVPLEDDSVAR